MAGDRARNELLVMIVDPIATRCAEGHSLVKDCAKRYDPMGTHHCIACELIAKRRWSDKVLLRLDLVGERCPCPPSSPLLSLSATAAT